MATVPFIEGVDTWQEFFAAVKAETEHTHASCLPAAEGAQDSGGGPAPADLHSCEYQESGDEQLPD